MLAAAFAAVFSLRSCLREFTTDIASVAVFPFENLTGDPGRGLPCSWSRAGTHRAALGRIDGLRDVVGTAGTRSGKYRAANVGVESLVQGAVERSPHGLRITTHLVGASSGNRIWTTVHDTNRGDFPRLRAELAQELALELRPNLSSADLTRVTASRPIHPQAYEYYLRGRHFWDKPSEPDIDKAVEYFRQAIRIEPSFARAHAAIALAYATMVASGFVRPSAFLLAAKKAALTSQELDDSLAETHTALAVAAVHEWDWQKFESELLGVIEPTLTMQRRTSGSDSITRVCLDSRRTLENVGRRMHLIPTKPVVSGALAAALALCGNKQAAREQFKKTIELAPELPIGHDLFGIFLESEGRMEEAIRELEKGDAPEALAHAYAGSGRRSDALRLLAKLEIDAKHRYVSPFAFAIVYAGLGAADRALDWLYCAYEEHDQRLHRLQVDSRLDSVRSHPRYLQLVGSMHFPARQN